DARRRLEEHDGIFGNRRAGFARVIDVVEPDRDEFGWHRNTWSEARFAFDQREPPGIDLFERSKRARRKRRAVDVLDLAGKIAQRPIGIDQSGLLAPGRAIAYEFHCRSPSLNLFILSSLRRTNKYFPSRTPLHRRRGIR